MVSGSGAHLEHAVCSWRPRVGVDSVNHTLSCRVGRPMRRGFFDLSGSKTIVVTGGSLYFMLLKVDATRMGGGEHRGYRV